MNDCPNAEMRDRLPDLLHESLDASVRALVVAHIVDCIDCQEELELLRGLHGVLVVELPRVNVSQIVSAIPKPRAAAVRPIRRSWGDWRIAAAVTLLAVGGSSIALVNRTHTPAVADSSIMAAATATAPVASAPVPAAQPDVAASDVAPATTTPAASAPAVTVANVDGGDDARLAGLSDQQLKTLLGEIDRLEALPVADPEPVSIRVNPGTPDGPEAIW